MQTVRHDKLCRFYPKWIPSSDSRFQLFSTATRIEQLGMKSIAYGHIDEEEIILHLQVLLEQIQQGHLNLNFATATGYIWNELLICFKWVLLLCLNALLTGRS